MSDHSSIPAYCEASEGVARTLDGLERAPQKVRKASGWVETLYYRGNHGRWGGPHRGGERPQGGCRKNQRGGEGLTEGEKCLRVGGEGITGGVEGLTEGEEGLREDVEGIM